MSYIFTVLHRLISSFVQQISQSPESSRGVEASSTEGSIKQVDGTAEFILALRLKDVT